MNRHYSLASWLACFGILVSLMAAPCVLAQEEKPAAKKEKAKKEAGEKADKEAEERYRVPEGDVDALLKFIEGIKNFEPTTAKESFAHRDKALPAIVAAAKKILEMEKDMRSPARVQAAGYILLGRLGELAAMSVDDQRLFLKDLKAHLEGREPTVDDLQIAMTAANAMEEKDQALGAEAYVTLGDVLAAANSMDEQVKSVAETMQGAGRRLNLVGKPIELTGKTVGGEAFNVASLKGKVVLVDFWATWCGPCIAEHPNMKKNYDAYKDRGFEIVGISLDQDREALDGYLKEKEVPWITLHEPKDEGQHPAARHYGVFGIPTMFLVGKDGKVVSTAARGEKLDSLLVELLGPAEAEKEEKE